MPLRYTTEVGAFNAKGGRVCFSFPGGSAMSPFEGQKSWFEREEWGGSTWGWLGPWNWAQRTTAVAGDGEGGYWGFCRSCGWGHKPP